MDAPLNKFFSVLTTLLLYILLIISTVTTIIDVAVSPTSLLNLNVACLVLYLLELIVLTLNFAVPKTSWYTRKTTDEKKVLTKRRQMIDNFMVEMLLYPVVICSTISLATRRPFSPETLTAADSESQMVSKALTAVDYESKNVGLSLCIIDTY